MAKLFFSHQRERWSFGDTFRVEKKKHKSKNTTKFKLDALPLMDLSQIYKLIL